MPAHVSSSDSRPRERRPRWTELPAEIRADIERLAGGKITSARNRPDGFSPGLASLLRLTDGALVFVKAIDGTAWPGQEALYRDEARIAAALPVAVPAPRFIGSLDDGRWVILAFEGIDGAVPVRLTDRRDVDRVAAAIDELALAATPSPIALPASHPRLGGWAGLEGDEPAARLGWLTSYADAVDSRRAARAIPWTAARLPALIALEAEGMTAAQGQSLVHFDVFPHNIVLTSQRALLVDWPHARLGAPRVDLLSFLSCVAGAGGDPEPVIASHLLTATAPLREIDGVLAALAGFALGHAPQDPPPALAPLFAAKISIGLGALSWLASRMGSPL